MPSATRAPVLLSSRAWKLRVEEVAALACPRVYKNTPVDSTTEAIMANVRPAAKIRAKTRVTAVLACLGYDCFGAARMRCLFVFVFGQSASGRSIFDLQLCFGYLDIFVLVFLFLMTYP